MCLPHKMDDTYTIYALATKKGEYENKQDA
jgi:hypothetical protein